MTQGPRLRRPLDPVAALGERELEQAAGGAGPLRPGPRRSKKTVLHRSNPRWAAPKLTPGFL